MSVASDNCTQELKSRRSHIERMRPRRPVPTRLVEFERAKQASQDNEERQGWQDSMGTQV